MRKYELLMIATPELEEEGIAELSEWAQGVITSNGGEIVEAEVLGRRRLAYPIKHKTDGTYVLIHAGMENNTIAELERSLKLNEQSLRHILVRLDDES